MPIWTFEPWKIYRVESNHNYTIWLSCCFFFSFYSLSHSIIIIFSSYKTQLIAIFPSAVLKIKVPLCTVRGKRGYLANAPILLFGAVWCTNDASSWANENRFASVCVGIYIVWIQKPRVVLEAFACIVWLCNLKCVNTLRSMYAWCERHGERGKEREREWANQTHFIDFRCYFDSIRFVKHIEQSSPLAYTLLTFTHIYIIRRSMYKMRASVIVVCYFFVLSIFSSTRTHAIRCCFVVFCNQQHQTTPKRASNKETWNPVSQWMWKCQWREREKKEH